MSIDKKDVEKVARLARLEVEDKRAEQLVDELGDVLEYVGKLEELETEDVEPTTHPVAGEHAGREDEVNEGLAVEQVVGQAPDQQDGQFRVPKVVDE
jgi:aspartyl-tRNA(Asn)/glutamyl-tRNA(Gln) amidotransferase subunit C